VAEQCADAALDRDDPLPALADLYGRTVEDLAFVLLRHRPDDRSNCVDCSFHRMCPWDGCVHAFAARGKAVGMVYPRTRPLPWLEIAECWAGTTHVLLGIERRDGEWTVVVLRPLPTPRSGE
jgi:hypothetical protein